ncbi:phage major capsid protein [Bradyrhizobium sediminis]|uniref:Phage major capsid protein n=1 Tax=Bradyrhizobium sediminis TaxID=2840469 RepID=A0A975N9K6_9BRAD|nr:phage major capsid protein [Bradyrhizobium sediminis]QWG11027.1 phage major capsid protein [Bradyrhizobium sediminis]
MLHSVKISRRQSEIRKDLAALVGKDKPSEDETRSMESLDSEYQANETKFRAALIVEDSERREAKDDLETRSDRDYGALIDKFELRQVALMLDEGRQIDGATAEVVQELRSQGGYRGVPVPWQALEKRSGETVASGTPAPKTTGPIIDRIFADSAAVQMGAQMVNIDQGTNEYPITSSSVAAAWQTSETGSVGGPTAYSTAERSLAPNNTLGITMKITRKTLKQSGDGLEQAVRRDMNGCMAVALDKAVFLGAGASGEPAGILVGSYGITSTAVSAAASWAAFRAAIKRFIVANAANGPSAVKLLIRPEVWDAMDDDLITNTAVSEWDRLIKNIGAGNVVMSSNALAAPVGSPLATKALLTTTANGVSPIFVGTWGAIDLIRDPFSDAASGGLRLTALATLDVTASRAEQLQILTGIQ